MMLASNSTPVNILRFIGGGVPFGLSTSATCTGWSLSNRVAFGNYIAKPVGYYATGIARPVKAGGTAARLAAMGAATGSPTATGRLIGSAAGIASVTPNANMGKHGTISLSGAGVISSASLQGKGSIAAVVEIGSRPSAFDITQAVLNAVGTQYNTDGTIGQKINGVASADAIAAAFLDLADAIETGLTVRQALRLMSAVLAGRISGADTDTVTIRNVGDTIDRIVATVDARGNRIAITKDLS